MTRKSRCECKYLLLIVNATILVILSTRLRVSGAAIVTTEPTATTTTSSSTTTTLEHHHQQVAGATASSQHRPALGQRAEPMQPTSERNNNSRPSAPAPAATTTTTTATANDPDQNNEQMVAGQSARLIAPTGAHDTNPLAYLQRYGYMQAPAGAETSNNLISEESFSSAVAEFQRFAGLPETGQVDNQTLNMMRMPRCGNVDKQQVSTGAAKTASIVKSGQLRSWLSAPAAAVRRRKRYALQGSKWRRQELTYRISQYPTKFVGRKHEVDAQIERAFGIWSQVAPIDFVVKKEGRVHIDIRFASGDHGDGDAFDGPGNTLAHAYFPQYGGDAHFDDQEYWTVDSYAGTNIFQVAAHELGHSLGLGHSNVREALMAPFYQKYKPNFKLHIDDVLAIQALYGEKAFLPEVPGEQHIGGGGAQQRPAGGASPTPTSTTTTTTTSTTTSTTTTARPFFSFGVGPKSAPPIYRGNKRPASRTDGDSDSDGDNNSNEEHDDQRPPSSVPAEPSNNDDNGHDRDDNANPDLSSNGINGFGQAPADPMAPAANLCHDSVIDAITRTEDGNSYVFKGDHYWLLTNEGLARGYPRRIADDWDGLPSHLDAALTWADGKTFFFKGNKYWRFRNRRRDLGYPKLISAGFAGIPDDIDAAFVWSGNGRTYFFKGTEYWRFDSKAEPPVSSEYPRSIKVWLGVPFHINAAFKWDNNVTYFFKGNQYYRFNDREFKVSARRGGHCPVCSDRIHLAR
jgi:matrix metalloproteinase-14 (membrane-inserted)